MNSSQPLRLLGVLIATTIGSVAFAADETNPQVERGRYLVNQVGMCNDCHSPRGERGAFLPGKELTGSVLGFAPSVPMPVWAPAAPAIAGLEGFTTEQAVKFLTTGERPSGAPARPPMPEFRFAEDDAKAVVAYLKSLKQRP